MTETTHARLRALLDAGGAWPPGEGVGIHPGIMGGVPCVPGTRIDVATIVAVAAANGVDEVPRWYDVTPAQVAAALAYHAAHRARYDAERWAAALDSDPGVGDAPGALDAVEADLRALLTDRDRLAAALAEYADATHWRLAAGIGWVWAGRGRAPNSAAHEALRAIEEAR